MNRKCSPFFATWFFNFYWWWGLSLLCQHYLVFIEFWGTNRNDVENKAYILIEWPFELIEYQKLNPSSPGRLPSRLASPRKIFAGRMSASCLMTRGYWWWWHSVVFSVQSVFRPISIRPFWTEINLKYSTPNRSVMRKHFDDNEEETDNAPGVCATSDIFSFLTYTSFVDRQNFI